MWAQARESMTPFCRCERSFLAFSAPVRTVRSALWISHVSLVDCAFGLLNFPGYDAEGKTFLIGIVYFICIWIVRECLVESVCRTFALCGWFCGFTFGYCRFNQFRNGSWWLEFNADTKRDYLVACAQLNKVYRVSHKAFVK